MAQDQSNNSATAPVVGFVLGVVLTLSGNAALMAFGVLVVLGSGVLLFVRLLFAASDAANKKPD